MARCLHPLTISHPGEYGRRQLRFVSDRSLLSRYARDNIRPMRSECLVVPCGKCLACLKNKQSSMVVRCLREAQQRGSFAFMTLTYDDDHLPLVESMWKVDLKSGEQVQCETPEFVSTGFHPEKPYLDLFRSDVGGVMPRYRSFVHCRILNYEWQIRVTPSVCRQDVRQWLKQARIQYQRDYGEKLPDFSYVAISEYGPRTCRPHYHLAFFGLKHFHVQYLLNAWKFGKVKQVRMVNVTPKDFIRASKYIGKYMSKGKFECDSVKCGDAQKPRVCQSMHFGTRDLDDITSYLKCEDMVGRYDLRTLSRPDGEPLTRLQVDSLVREIPRRLIFRVDEKTTLPLPRGIRQAVFYFLSQEDKTKKVPSVLWSMVASAIRDDADRHRADEFAQFCADHPERTSSENHREFAYFEAYRSGLEESTLQEDYRLFYSKSYF